MVRIQRSDFCIEDEILLMKKISRNIGCIATFLGTVREFSYGKRVRKIAVEQYPEMAKKKLHELRERALTDFDIIEAVIIHRIGELDIGDNIVLIIIAAQHRKDAFNACCFCIEELKKTAPLWKIEEYEEVCP